MILFTILLILFAVIAAIALIAAIIGGAGLLVLFGDAAVFGLIVWLFVKVFKKKKK